MSEVRQQPRTVQWRYAVAGLVAAAIALVALLWYGKGARPTLVPGLPHGGPVTTWALPTATLVSRLAAVATIGLLLAAVVLSPRHESGSLSGIGYRRLRASGWAALLWCIASLVALVFHLSDLLGAPVHRVVSVNALISFVTDVIHGKALAFSGGLAALVFVISRVALRPTGGVIALGLALLAMMPPAFTSHTTDEGDHQVAVSTMLLHIVPTTLWAGGLLALVLVGTRNTGQLATAVRRFSPLATVCLLLVAGSGLLSAVVRLPRLSQLVTSEYGQLMLVKTAILVAIAAVGWWQRRAAMPALRRGDRRRFATVTAVELVLFGLVLGAAVALSRTAAPRGTTERDLAMGMLGYPMPPPLTFERLFTEWLPDPIFILAGLSAAVAYAAGVWRLRRRGDQWPMSRTLLFLAGCGLLIVATCSGLARYGPVLFSVHMAQHLLLTMAVPILLVLGGPITLALRALSPAQDPAWPGPREWLLAALHSPVSRFVTHPIFALAFYMVSMYAMYLTGLFELALRSHAGHLLMMGHFLLAGYLFFWVVIGVDPSPRGRPAPPLRAVVMLASMAMHAFLGIVIMSSRSLFAAEWFNTLPRPWGPTPLDDQYVAGGIAWSFGEVPGLIVIAALIVQWIRSDEREQRRLDRAEDRAEAEGRESEALRAYNEMLAKLAQRDANAAR
ncbi:MAG TPA: cytochrome c oxidase assembly protein [Natronosporangium sp.]|nr:cytochrome c oxidase assembly protein [Natronosporangium sp.]